MKFSVGPLSLSINRKSQNYNASVSMEDVRAINNDHVNYLKGLSSTELKSRVQAVSFEDLYNCDLVRSCLTENGIVIVPEFIDTDIVVSFGKVISDLRQITNEFLRANIRVDENEHMLLQIGAEKLSGYQELSSYKKTVVQVREGQDQGMIDIFNVDIAFPEVNILRKAYEDSGLKEILSSPDLSVGFKNLNFYLNSNVTSTRGFHADSYTPQLKAFVYLTDCLSLDDGPYTYVKGSQKDNPYRRLNREMCTNLPNKTEAPLLNRDDILPVLASRGSLVISDQSGFHRGFPQEEGHERVISVMNIK
jgi:hypothetical protein